MKYRIQLARFHGIENPENESEVMVRRFYSQFDPQFERLASTILLLIEPKGEGKKITPEMRLESLLVTIDPKGIASVYFNHLRVEMECRSRHHAIDAGQDLTLDDISSVESISFKSVEIQRSDSIIHIFQTVGRFGIYFDFSPALTGGRIFNVHEELAKCYSYLFFRDRIELPKETWKALRRAGWFPFIGLKEKTLLDLTHCVEKAGDETELLATISAEFIASLADRVSSWSKESFVSQKPFIAVALERFNSKDYVSSINILYPRIEGILRSNFALSGGNGEPNQGKLVQAATPLGDLNGSVLMPQRFRDYLTKVYFRHFQRSNSGSLLSRHTISHGTAQINCFTQKWAIIGFLILDQLYFLSGD